MALNRAEIDHEVVGISEIDRYAIKAYNAVHGDTPNFGDISKINWSDVPDFDLFTYSFPCTDISAAGKQAGFARGSGTQSSLLWECEHAIREKLPRFLLMENVKALSFKKNAEGFNEWINILGEIGYKSSWVILNAKDFGIPQNRERIFMVSTFGDSGFTFPEKRKLNKSISDIMESGVSEKYFLKRNTLGYFLEHKLKSELMGRGFKFGIADKCGVARCIATRSGSRATDNYIVDDFAEISNPLLNDMSIRRLTPKECFRLMGVSDGDIDTLCESGISDAQLYKMAGNSIVVDVLVEIFKNLLK